MEKRETIVIARESIADQVFRYIKRMILSGDLKGGQRVPEGKIADRLGVSRTPIREAIKRISEYGLIDVKPRSYSVVTQLDLAEAEQIASVRAQLERLSIKLFTKAATETDFAVVSALAINCEALISESDPAGIFVKDSELHLEIARRAGNRCLFDFLERLDAKVQLMRMTVCLSLDEIAKDIRQHGQILETMLRRDAGAAMALVERHILQHFRACSADEQTD